MNLRTLLRIVVAFVTVLCVSMTLMTPVNAATGDNQVENTLKHLLKEAGKNGGVTVANLTAVTNSKVGQNSWERGVDFHVTDTYASVFGAISLAAGPDGTIGMATRSSDGGCTMTIYQGGKITTWSMGDVGKNCTGASALGGKTAPVLWSDPVAPAAPSGLNAVAGDSQVTLVWGAPGDLDLTHYEILQDGIVVATIPAGTTTLLVTNLVNGTTYAFQVRSVDQAKNVSLPSNMVNATPVDLTPPVVPMDLRGSVTSETTVLLTWDASSSADLAYYNIYQDGVLVGTSTKTTSTISGLTQDVTYLYHVTAVDQAGNESAASNMVELTTRDMTAPGAPQDLVGNVVGPTSVQLRWNSVDVPDLASYNIYQDGVLAGTSTTPSYTVSGLTSGTSYRYYVTSVDTSGNESEASNTLTLTPEVQGDPREVTGLTGVLVDSNANLTWLAPTTTGVYYYQVRQVVNGVVTTKVVGYGNTTTGASAPSFTTMNGLSLPDTTYTYQVRAYWLGNIWGEWSNTLELTTLPQAPGSSATLGYYGAHLGASATDQDGNIYLTGGTTSARNVGVTTASKWDSATQSWKILPPMLNPRYNHLSLVDNAGRLFVFGGQRFSHWSQIPGATSEYWHTGVYRQSAEMYDPATNRWTLVATPPTARGEGASIVKDSEGRMVLVGGITHNFGPGGNCCYSNKALFRSTSSVERYDPQANTWATLASLPSWRFRHAVAIDSQDRIYAVGGFSSLENNVSFQTSTYRYNPTLNTWSSLAPISQQRSDMGIAVDNQDRVYVVGGLWGTYSYGYTNWILKTNIERFDPISGTWSIAGHLPEMTSNVAVTTDLNGDLIFSGGRAMWAVTGDIHRFDTQSGTLTKIGRLQRGRGDADVYVASDGAIHTVGGYTYNTSSNSTREWNAGSPWFEGNSVTATGLERYLP